MGASLGHLTETSPFEVDNSLAKNLADFRSAFAVSKKPRSPPRAGLADGDAEGDGDDDAEAGFPVRPFPPTTHQTPKAASAAIAATAATMTVRLRRGGSAPTLGVP